MKITIHNFTAVDIFTQISTNLAPIVNNDSELEPLEQVSYGSLTTNIDIADKFMGVLGAGPFPTSECIISMNFIRSDVVIGGMPLKESSALPQNILDFQKLTPEIVYKEYLSSNSHAPGCIKLKGSNSGKFNHFTAIVDEDNSSTNSISNIRVVMKEDSINFVETWDLNHITAVFNRLNDNVKGFRSFIRKRNYGPQDLYDSLQDLTVLPLNHTVYYAPSSRNLTIGLDKENERLIHVAVKVMLTILSWLGVMSEPERETQLRALIAGDEALLQGLQASWRYITHLYNAGEKTAALFEFVSFATACLRSTFIEIYLWEFVFKEHIDLTDRVVRVARILAQIAYFTLPIGKVQFVTKCIIASADTIDLVRFLVNEYEFLDDKKQKPDGEIIP